MEAAREVEFGAPSMHVALVLCMVFFASHLFGVGPGLQCAGVAWVGVIAWGRLYLGVHSPVVSEPCLGAARSVFVLV